MSTRPFHNAWVLSGPTGCGKSDCALRLAEFWNAEIVAMDSMTLYRGLDIGTAKPLPEDRQRIRHHLIDILYPWESANVAWWRDRAIECCRDIEARGKRALFVGGTPLYLKALLLGLFAGPAAHPEIRCRLEAVAANEGPQALHGQLAKIDPPTARRLHPNDIKRVVRALEVWELTGQPISNWQQQWRGVESGQPVVAGCWWLDRPRLELYARIDARVERMMASGWLDEARRLRESPKPLSREARLALGYRELFAHLAGQFGLAEATRQIQTRSRQFAKRQLTWLRNMPECKPIPLQGDTLPDPRIWSEFA